MPDERPRPRVLIADDYEGILTALTRLLQPSCDVVGCVTDGIALVEAAKALAPDVVVVDLAMPKMNGLEACRQIRLLCPDTRIVVLTATDDEAVRETAFSLGASAFVLKYLVADQLLPAIQTAAFGDAG